MGDRPAELDPEFTKSSLPQDGFVVVEIRSGTAKVVARGDDLDTVSNQLKTGNNVGDEPKPTFYYVLQENTVERVNCDGPGRVLPQDLRVARNLLYIHNQPPYKVAYERWIRVRESASKRLESKRLRLGFRKNEIYTLVGMYFVFQTALLAFSGTSTKLKCTNIWIPYALTISATVAVILGILQKFRLILELNDAIDKDTTEYKIAVKRLRALEHLGPRFDWSECYKQPDKRTQLDAIKEIIRFFQNLLKLIWSLCTQLDCRILRCIRDRTGIAWVIAFFGGIRDRTSGSHFIVCLILISFGFLFFFAHRSILPCP